MKSIMFAVWIFAVTLEVSSTSALCMYGFNAELKMPRPFRSDGWTNYFIPALFMNLIVIVVLIGFGAVTLARL